MIARALFIAAVFAAGLVVGSGGGAPAGVWIASGILGAAVLSAAALAHRSHREPSAGELLPRVTLSGAILVLAGTFLIGAGDSGLRFAALERSRLDTLDGRVVDIQGVVAGDVEPERRASRFDVTTEKIHGLSWRGKVSVRAFGEAPAIEPGDEVRFEAKIRTLDRDDGFDRHLMLAGISGEATVAGEVQRVAKGGSPALRAANAVRTAIRTAALRALDSTDGNLLLGLTIGDDSRVPDDVVEDFRASGLSHLTAVSGANLAIALGALFLVLRALGAGRRTQIATGLVTIVFFGLVARGEPSVLRAAVMASLALAAFFFGRRYQPIYGAGAAFVALLAFDPFLLWSVGFQLSFAAAFGILVIAPRALERLQRWPRPLAEALAVSAAAQIAVTPFLWLHFQRLSLFAVPANLVAFPFVAPATILGFVGGLTGLVWPAGGRAVMEVASPAVSGIRSIAHFFAGLPGAALPVSDLGPFRTTAVLTAIVGASAWLLGRRRAAVPAVAAALVAVLPGLGMFGFRGSPPGLRATFFDVGQGDAALVESPGGARVLVDGGPDPAGLRDELRGRGVDRIDVVVFSHSHYDHINGLDGLGSAVRVRKSIEPGVPDPLIRRILHGREAEAAREGGRLQVGDLLVDVLGPTDALRSDAAEESAGSVRKEGSALNEASVVARVSWERACVLFTGDIEETAQLILVDRHRSQIECAVLKAPHHGSAHIDESFVKAVAPNVVVISVGPNDYGHPSGRALTLFSSSGATILRTDRLGDIVIDIDSSGRPAVSSSRAA